MLAVIMLTFFVVLSLHILSIAHFVYSSETVAWQGRQREAVQRGAEIIQNFMDDIQGTLLMIARLQSEQVSAQKALLQAGVEHNQALLEIVLVDENGKVQDSSAMDENILDHQFTIRQSSWFRSAREGQRYISDIFISPQGTAYVILAIPAGNGSVVAGRISMDILASEVQHIRIGESGSAFIVDEKGFVVAHNKMELVLNKTSIIGHQALEASIAEPNQNWQGRYDNLDGIQVAGMSTRIPGTTWTIITEITAQEAYSNSSKALLVLSLSSALIWMLASIGSVSLLNKMVFIPIRSLQAGAEEIGEGNYDHQVSVLRRDEVGRVSEAFNQMISSLKLRDSQLNAQKLELSAEVEDRKKAQHEAQKRFVEQLAMQEASLSLSASLEFPKMMERIAEQICKAVDSTSVYIMTFDVETRISRVIAEFCGEEACELECVSDLGATYEETNDVFIAAIVAGDVWTESINSPIISESSRANLAQFGGKSRIFVPLSVRNRLIGFAEIWESRYPRSFNEEEVNLCKAIAQNAAVGLENLRLYEETRHQLGERERAQAELRVLNELLEERVHERTVELLNANNQLKQEIIERQFAEESLRRSEERYSLAARGANDGLWDWDLTENKAYFSPRWKAMLGYPEEAISADPMEWINRIHPDDLSKFQRELDAHLGGLSSHFENEHRMVHKDGTLRWMLARGLAVRGAMGVASRFAGSLTDITLRKSAEEQLTHDALHDALTSLPNRALFLDRLERSLELSRRREDYLFAVLFLDTDRFKLVNDTLGHNIGDKLLVAIARSLQASLRETDTIARLGGDEFVILLDDVDSPDEALKIADRIQVRFSKPFKIEGHEIFITTSIGIILSELEYEKPTDVLSDADIAMYRAKAQGRAQYVVFEPKMRTSLVARMELENDLRRALDNNEFRLYYQPIMVLGTGNLTGFEALVRWQHPHKGMIPPGDFITIAEESGLILPLGWWILKEACTQLQLWHEKYPDFAQLSMSVNLSSLQFKQNELAERVSQILAETGLDSRYLKLEITESIIMDNAQGINDTILKLKAMGVKVYIDDFGTGYSSLGYLQQYPIDTIKIDRSFIQRIDQNGENTELVRAILNLARDLKLSVIAEGIETESQLVQLREWSCEYGQGYYFSRPIDPEKIEALLGADVFITSPRYEVPIKQQS